MITGLCLKCAAPIVSDVLVPTLCTECGGKWRRAASYIKTPEREYKLSENDRRLLRSLKIQPEV